MPSLKSLLTGTKQKSKNFGKPKYIAESRTQQVGTKIRKGQPKPR